jgi:glucose/arabinose dehydrogenase
MASQTQTTSTDKSAPRAAPAPKPTRAAKAKAPKAAPKPVGSRSPVAVATFFRDDAGYVKAVPALQNGFIASTRKGNSDLPKFHLHRVQNGELCSVAARAPSNGEFTERYVKVVTSGSTPAALLRYRAQNFEGRPLHVCQRCCSDVKID